MDKTLASGYPSEPGPRARRYLIIGSEISKRLGDAAHRNDLVPIALPNAEPTARRFAKAHSLLKHRVEHRREVARGGIDDLQYLCSRGLLLQCLPRLGDQPSILHC